MKFRRRFRCMLVLPFAALACSGSPHVKAPAPSRAEAAQCAGCCDDSVSVIEIDPASTLDFHPSRCTLQLAGWYALNYAVLDREVNIFLFCQEPGRDERSLAIRYHGAPVSDVPLEDLLDPFHTDGRENANTVSYAFPHPPARYRFERGVVTFDRPPRSKLETSHESRYAELGLDLHFEGNRRFRAALRICPSYERTGPVSDPVN
jgi:hypothetical protein